jgi:hypothetical protein
MVMEKRLGWDKNQVTASHQDGECERHQKTQLQNNKLISQADQASRSAQQCSCAAHKDAKPRESKWFKTKE